MCLRSTKLPSVAGPGQSRADWRIAPLHDDNAVRWVHINQRRDELTTMEIVGSDEPNLAHRPFNDSKANWSAGDIDSG